MSDERQTFLVLAMAGQVGFEEIDDYIDQWHHRPIGLALHEYLGMTRDEYELWLSSPDMLSLIVAARKQHQSLDLLAHTEIEGLRAGASVGSEVGIKRLQDWLRNRSRHAEAS